MGKTVFEGFIYNEVFVFQKALNRLIKKKNSDLYCFKILSEKTGKFFFERSSLTMIKILFETFQLILRDEMNQKPWLKLFYKDMCTSFLDYASGRKFMRH